MIKIDIISGFLGAGKTTLIKKLFESGFKNEKVVIIENEFGDIGIDSGFLKDSGVQIKEINAGCICCSLVGDFTTAIKDLINQYSPDRIIIEPSGVGKLSDIINAVQRTELPNIKLNILATVVDGKKAKMHLKNFGEFFLNQIETATSIVVSKTENLSNEQLESVLHLIKEHNSQANIITTSLLELDSAVLLKTLEEQHAFENFEQEVLEEHHHCCHHEDHEHEEHHCCHHEEEHEDECSCHHNEHHEEECSCHHEEEHHHCCHHEEDHEEHCCCHHEEEEHHCHHDHHHHDADEVFASWGIQTTKQLTKEELTTFLNKLNDESLGLIVRCKGILKAKDNEKWYYFDYVSNEIDIRLGEADYTGRIVVIGSKIDKEKIASIFESL